MAAEDDVLSMDLVLGTLGVLLAWFGPWSRLSWQALSIWSAAVYCLLLGVMRLLSADGIALMQARHSLPIGP